MSRTRLHVPRERFEDGVRLLDAERHYLCDVLRLGEGDELEIFDGAGRTAMARLRRDPKGWRLQWFETVREREAARQVILAAALIKARSREVALRMAVELGVDEFWPLVSERCVVRACDGRSGRLERERHIAAEAARQCGRATVPEVHLPVPLDEALSLPADHRVILQENVVAEPLAALAPRLGPGRLLLLVGPEGGFSPAEFERSLARGFVAASLGPRVLRADTAAVVAAALGGLGSLAQR